MNGHRNSGKNPKFYFSYAIRKYGWENFTKEILIDDVPEEDLDNLEINYIAFYDSFNRENGYNRTKGGGGVVGYIYTEEQRQAMSERNTKNHSVDGGGSVFFCNTIKKWAVIGSQTSGKKHIGYYLTKEKACQALKLYNETGERTSSDITIRKKGTGCVFFCNTSKRWIAIGYGKKRVGSYFSEEQAIRALDLYNGTGQCMPSDSTFRKSGTGTIRERPSKKVGMRYRGQIRINGKPYRTKTYGSREDAESELNQIIINNQ